MKQVSHIYSESDFKRLRDSLPEWAIVGSLEWQGRGFRSDGVLCSRFRDMATGRQVEVTLEGPKEVYPL